MARKVKPWTEWIGPTWTASMSGVGTVTDSEPPAWNLPATISVAQSGSVGVRQYTERATGWTIAVTGLATGLTYNSGTESIDGAATGTASGTATFTLSKSGETNVVDTTTVALIELGDWQLDAGHFTPAKMPMTLVHPRPSGETQSWARHKWAYPNLTGGYRIPIAVQGGAYPLYFEIITQPGGGQPDASIGQQVGDADYGILSWNPTSNGGPYTITVRVYDQENPSTTPIDVTWSVTVTDSTDRFIFIDPSAGTSGSGAIGSPVKLFSEAWGPSTHKEKIAYLRSGAHYTREPANAVMYISYRANINPMAIIGYPGESPHLSCENANFDLKTSGSFGSAYTADLFVSNVRIKDSNNTDGSDSSRFFSIRGSCGARAVWFEMTFDNHRPSVPGSSNQGVVHYGAGSRSYITVWNVDFTNCPGRNIGSTYDSVYGVMEGCKAVAPHGGELLDLKVDGNYWSFRRNESLISGAAGHVFQTRHGKYSSGTADHNLHTEVCYNLLRVTNIFTTYKTAGLSMPTATHQDWVYRNTIIEGNHNVEDGYFVWTSENNVYITDKTLYPTETANNTVVVGTGAQADLTGAMSELSTILDANYLLQGSYRTTYLGTHGHEIA